MELPFISIVIPTRRSREVLRQCLDSLEKQTYPKEKIEVVLVSSSPLEIHTSLLTRVVTVGSETGYAEARNKGVAEAKGEVLAFLDDDCAAPQDWLAEAVLLFQSDEKISLVGGMYDLATGRVEFFPQ